MTHRKAPSQLIAPTLAILVGGLLMATAATGSAEEVHRYRHPGLPGEVIIERTPSGDYLYEFSDGPSRRQAPPAEFARYLANDLPSPSLAFRILNISSPVGLVWIALGLGGQILFALRMIVQWLVSEKARRSVVPVAFWWISLGGASLLLAYFIWRRDVVGILGQATGWAIYLRNLVLIYRTDTSSVA